MKRALSAVLLLAAVSFAVTAVSAEKMEMARHLNEGAQRDAIERGRVVTSQGVQIKLVAVVGGHHGQAGKATFGRFRLPNDG